MKKEQENYIISVNHSSDEEICIKKTGWEDINFPAHSHPKIQIIYTLSGTVRIQTETTSYFVPSKHIVWIPANMKHELYSNNRKVSLVIFYLSLEYTDSHILKQFCIYNINTVIAENMKFIASKGELIKRNQSQDLYDFAISFFRLLPSMNANAGILLKTLSISIPEDTRLLPVLHFMSEHAHENLKMEQVAQKFGFSVRNLSRLLHHSGIRFSAYLNYQRITRAIELLAEDDRPIAQIAYAVGFSAPNNFNRVFRQVTGMSPSIFLHNKELW